MGEKIRDRALIFVDAKYAGTIEQPASEVKFTTPSSGIFLNVKNKFWRSLSIIEKHTLSLLVENQGRINWAAPSDKGRLDSQRKGILGEIHLNGKSLENWKMWPLSLNSTMLTSLLGQKDWWSDACSAPILPGLIKATLKVDGPPKVFNLIFSKELIN